jgi:alanine-glyoxylate transaminase/serine-glyoxylate transaminase/serine-pyruvate transaminase
MGTLGGVEMGLALARVPHTSGGVDAAMAVLTGQGTATEQAARRAAG